MRFGSGYFCSVFILNPRTRVMTDECAKVTRRLGSNRIWQGPLHEQSRFSTSWALVVWWCQVHGEAAVSASAGHPDYAALQCQ